MQEKKLPEGNHEHINQSPLEERTTYHIEGRSFVVQPVFKKGKRKYAWGDPSSSYAGGL